MDASLYVCVHVCMYMHAWLDIPISSIADWFDDIEIIKFRCIVQLHAANQITIITITDKHFHTCVCALRVLCVSSEVRREMRAVAHAGVLSIAVMIDVGALS